MSVTSDVAFRIKASDQGAERSFASVTAAQEKLKESVRKISGETETQSRSVKELISGWGGLIGKVTMLGSMTALVKTLTGAIDDQKRALKEIGQVGRAESEMLNSFRSVQAPGDAGRKFFEDALKMGAGLGIKPSAAAQTIEPIQSALNQGDVTLTPEERAKILGASEAALRGQVLGIPADVSGLIEVQGVTRGMQPGELTAMTLRAAAMSAFSQRDFGKALPDMQNWKKIEDAMAAGIVISQQITDPGEFGTMVKSAGRLLGPSGDTETLIEMLGLQGTDPLTRLQGLREFAQQEGLGLTTGVKSQAEFAAMAPEERLKYQQQSAEAVDTFSRSLGKYGVDIRVAQSVGALIRGMEQFQDLSAQFESVRGIGTANEGAARTAYTQGVIGDMWGRVMGMPGAERDFAVNRAEATTRLNALIGPQSKEAEDALMLSYAQGLRRQNEGFSTGFNPETGQRDYSETLGGVTKWVERGGQRHRELRGMSSGDPGTFLNQEIDKALGGMGEGASGTTAELGAWLSGLTAALEANTRATEASTAVEGSGGPASVAVMGGGDYGEPAFVQQARNRRRNRNAGQE